MATEGSLPCSQKPATGPSPQPDESSPHSLTRFHFHSIVLPSMPRYSAWPLPIGFPTYAFVIFPMRATCPDHLILLDLIILIICSEAYKSCSSSFRNFLCPPFTSSLLVRNILLFSPSICLLPLCDFCSGFLTSCLGLTVTLKCPLCREGAGNVGTWTLVTSEWAASRFGRLTTGQRVVVTVGLIN
jgi:hypothetical protein